MPSDSAKNNAHDIRMKCRNGTITASTSGLATTMQTNLIVLPSKYAHDFRNLCLRNPVPCPLLEVLPAGQFESKLAKNSDVRTDIPAYNIYQDGILQREVLDVKEEWTEDHVGFLIGCSYSFETALKDNGLPPRSMMENKAVPMFITNILLIPAGAFKDGHAVVSMRSYKEADVERVRKITSSFPRQHGEPVAWGWDGASQIGILEKVKLGRSDFGDSFLVPDDEVPVFWGCGVSPQIATRDNEIQGIVLAHKPGSMFVTDLSPDDESSLTLDLLKLE